MNILNTVKLAFLATLFKINVQCSPFSLQGEVLQSYSFSLAPFFPLYPSAHCRSVQSSIINSAFFFSHLSICALQFSAELHNYMVIYVMEQLHDGCFCQLGILLIFFVAHCVDNTGLKCTVEYLLKN